VAADVTKARREWKTRAQRWRDILRRDDDDTSARSVVTLLLNGRVTVIPRVKGRVWELRGEGTFSGLFTGEVFPSGWRPHRDSNPGFSLERAAS
jgi:hypothetical protein